MIRKLFIISLIWSVLILILSAIPGDALPSGPLFNIPYLDKIVHAGLYFPLAFFLGAEFDLSKKNILRIAGPFLTMLIVALYGALIEIMQEKLFVDRVSDLADLFADVIGGLAGLTIYYLFFRPFFHRLSERQS